MERGERRAKWTQGKFDVRGRRWYAEEKKSYHRARNLGTNEEPRDSESAQ